MLLNLGCRVFLSHSGRDIDFVQRLCRDLYRSYPGIEVVLSDEDKLIVKGETTTMERSTLEKARESALGVLVLTDDFFTHTRVPMLELEAFVANNVRLLPLFLTMSVEEFREKERWDRWVKKWEEWAAADYKLVTERWRYCVKRLRFYNGLHKAPDGGLDLYIETVVQQVARIVGPAVPMSGKDVYGKRRLCQMVDGMYKKCTSRRSSRMFDPPPAHGTSTSTCVGLGHGQDNGLFKYDLVGIYGIAGLGKTTLCKSLCFFYFKEMKSKVCYIDLELSSSSRLSRMQHVLFGLVDNGDTKHIHNLHLDNSQLENMLKEQLSSIEDPVFLAIDNIFPKKESIEEALMYLRCELPKGSKILITSRSGGTLTNLTRLLPHGCSSSTVIEHMPALEFKEARDIFEHEPLDFFDHEVLDFHKHPSSNAPDTEEDLERVVNEFVNMCTIFEGKQYHPLILKMLARTVKRGDLMPHLDLKGRLAKLKGALYEDDNACDRVFQVFDITYGLLSEQAKQVFLDMTLCYNVVHNIDLYEWVKRFHLAHSSSKRDLDSILLQLLESSFIANEEHSLRIHDLANEEHSLRIHDLAVEFAKHKIRQRPESTDSLTRYVVLDDGYRFKFRVPKKARYVSISRCKETIRTLDLRDVEGLKVLHLLDNPGLEEVLLSRTSFFHLRSLIISVPAGTALCCTVSGDCSSQWLIKWLQLEGNVSFCFQTSEFLSMPRAAQILLDSASEIVGAFPNSLVLLSLDSLLPGSVQSIDVTPCASNKTIKLHNMLGLTSIQCSESSSSLQTAILQDVPHLEQLRLPVVSQIKLQLRFSIGGYHSLQRVYNFRTSTAAGRLLEKMCNEFGILQLFYSAKLSRSCASNKIREGSEGSVLQSEAGFDAQPFSGLSRDVALEESSPIRVAVAVKDHSSRPDGIVVGVEYHPLSGHGCEFFFSTREDMAACVGVGLERGKVVLNSKWSVTIEEMEVDEWKSKAASWGPILSDQHAHLRVAGTQAPPAEHVGKEQQTQLAGMAGNMLARLCGVESDGALIRTGDADQSNWPLIFDIALQAFAPQEGNDGTEKTGSLLHDVVTCSTRTTIQSLASLKGKHKQTEGEEDHDGVGVENDEGPSRRVREDHDDPPKTQFKVTVLPRAKQEVLDQQGRKVRPDAHGLDVASIGPTLTFKFWRSNESKRLSISARTMLQLHTQSDVLDHADRCWWYHKRIETSITCEDTEAHPVSGRVAILKSGKICNEVSQSSKVGAKRNTTSSATNTFGVQGQLGVPVTNVQVSTSCTDDTADSREESSEVEFDTVCDGFLFTNCSCWESPARVKFKLSYPLGDSPATMLAGNEIFHGKGLFSTIFPEIEGTWVPLNEHNASPYVFRIERSLTCQSGTQAGSFALQEYKQPYLLALSINHKMSHLKGRPQKMTLLEGHEIEDMIACFHSS